VTDLTEAGYVVKRKDGRRNRYQIQTHLPLPESTAQERSIGEVLAVLTMGAGDGGELLRARGAWSSGTSTGLSAVRVRALSIALEQAVAAGGRETLWAALTFSQGPVKVGMAELLRSFPGAVELPPLHHHIEDLQLAPFLLAKLNHQGQLVCSPEAMRLLLRSNRAG
jgi:hypothetical protein